MKQTLSHVLAASAAMVLMIGAWGCASDSSDVKAPPPRTSSSSSTPAARAGTNVPTGLDLYRNGLIESEQQIDKTLAALAELTDPNQQDIRGAYNKYCDQLARMKQHSDTLKREADAMRSSRDEYFGKWEAKSSEIENPTIRASAEARRKRLRDAHERIITTSADARDAYVPFMKDLGDIKKYLDNDLSKASIADLGDAAKKVQCDGAIVKEKIDAVV
jgi:hypothetical protein